MVQRALLSFLLFGALAACERTPTPETCAEFRWMTFSEYSFFGWTTVKQSKVCVIHERKIDP